MRVSGRAARSSRQQTSATFSEVGIRSRNQSTSRFRFLWSSRRSSRSSASSLQLVQVEHVSGLGIDLALDRQLQLVVVAVIVRIVTRSEHLLIPLIGKFRVVHPVGRVEVDLAGDARSGHGGEDGGSGERRLGRTKRRRAEHTKTPTSRRDRRLGRQRRGLLKPNENARRPHLDFCLPPRGMTSATAFGPIIGPVGSIMWLPVTARTKIGTGWLAVNVLESRTLRRIDVAHAVGRDRVLLAWIALVFFTSVNAGAVHLLLALSADPGGPLVGAAGLNVSPQRDDRCGRITTRSGKPPTSELRLDHHQ